MAANPRKIQEAVNHSAYLRSTRDDDIDKAPGFVRELWGEVFEEDIRKTADGAERSPKIMRNGMSKGIEFLIGFLELIGLLLKSALKIRDNAMRLGIRLDRIHCSLAFGLHWLKSVATVRW